MQKTTSRDMFIDKSGNKHIFVYKYFSEEISNMTDKELSKLKRTELLELLLYMREEIDNLQKENDELKRKISDTDINRGMLEKIMKAVCGSDETETAVSVDDTDTDKPENEDETVDSGETENSDVPENNENNGKDNDNEQGEA